jgi:hypothetical protein
MPVFPEEMPPVYEDGSWIDRADPDADATRPLDPEPATVGELPPTYVVKNEGETDVR